MIHLRFFLASLVTLATACGLAVALFLVMAIPFAWLWNAIPTVLFKLPRIGYWQAVGLLAFVKLLAASASVAEISSKSKESS